MKKVLLVLLAIVVAAGGCLAQEAPAGKATGDKGKNASQGRWHGVIARHNDDKSTFDVRKKDFEKTVVYDSSTKWTKGDKPADRSEFKDGSEIIALGSWDEKGRLMANRIDLRQRH
jgi:Ni/Co efflux regulator RcnB